MNRSLRKTKVAFWIFAVTAGVLQTWSSRFYIEPDGVNYLDIASAYQRGDWSAAVNGYWSPLFSWLLAILQSLFHPQAYWESTLLHLLNFLAYLLALACFEFFFGRLLALLRARFPDAVGDEGMPEWIWWVFGYTAFLLAALRHITLSMDTPDMVLAALLFLSTGLLIQLTKSQNGILHQVALGGVLGAAYLTKSVMFPLSSVYLFTNLFRRGHLEKPALRGLAALAVFVVVSSPFVIAISLAKGHLTFGETGKAAYFAQVSGLSTVAPLSSAALSGGKLLHPIRQLFDQPTVYEYATPLPGTFPPWYDESYWYEGTMLHFDLHDQLRATARAAASYFRILSQEKEWIAGWLVLAIFAGDWRDYAKRLLQLWFLWLPSLCMLAVYSLVLVESRYVAVALAVVWISLFAALPWSRINVAKRLGMSVFLAIGITTGTALVREEIPNLTSCLRPAAHVQWTVAKHLREMNFASGDRVAVLGHTTMADYWARLAGLKVVADVPLEALESYWMTSPERRAEISSSLRALGVKAIVSGTRPLILSGWQSLGDTGYYVQILADPYGVGRTSATPESVVR